MKNLEKFYADHFDGRTYSFEQYLELMKQVNPSQGLFKLESCEGDTGFLLRSDDGTYHIWFVEQRTDQKLYQVIETGTWYPNQLNQAMKDLMLQMCIDCEGLIERNGEKLQ